MLRVLKHAGICIGHCRLKAPCNASCSRRNRAQRLLRSDSFPPFAALPFLFLLTR